MRLEILNPESELDLEFAQWLRQKIIERFNAQLDPNKLVNWDAFFNNSLEYTLTSGIIRIEVILRRIITELQITMLPDKIIFSFSKNKYVPGFDRLSIDNLIRTITFGNASLGGYPIIVDTLQYYADNINDYIELYYAENIEDGS